MEKQFYDATTKKAIELEGIGENEDEEIDKHRHLYEMMQLQKLERKLRRIEQEKIKLLKREQKITVELKYKSWIHSAYLMELEQKAEAEARKRELLLTKLYARLNAQIRSRLAYNEGTYKRNFRKRTGLSDAPETMLFDGIRDQKVKSNWIKTPQPIVVNLQTMRCTRDKIPKGDFVLRVGVLDRLIENKMYYKFFEYGNRLKEQKMIEDEREKNKYVDGSLADMERQMSDFQSVNANADITKSRTLGGLFKETEEEDDLEAR